MYTPVAQRNSNPTTGYVPVAQRTATPVQPQVKVVQPPQTQTISGVVQAQPTQKITGVVQAKPTQTVGPVISAPTVKTPIKVVGANGTPAPLPTMDIPSQSETAESSTPSLLPSTFQTVYKSPDQIAWEEKSKSELFTELLKSPIKDLIVTPGVRMAQVLASPWNPSAGEQDVNIKIPGLGTYDIKAQKTGVAGAKQIAGQGLSAASWLYTPSKVVGVGRSILNDVAIQSIKDGVNITDKLVRVALWNTIKKSAAQGALIGSFSNLGTSLQGDGEWTDNAKDFVIGGVFGAALGGGMGAAGAGIAISKNKIAFVQKQLMQELIDRGLTPEHAQRMVSQGGYLGNILNKINPKAEELGIKVNELNKRWVENPTVANKKALDAVKKEYQMATQGGYLKNPFYSGENSDLTGKLPSQGSKPTPNQPGIQKSDISYTKSMPQPGSYVKERGFMTSLKNNPETESIFKDVVDNYHPHVNKEDIATVRAMSIMEPEKFGVLVRSSDAGAESTIAKVMYLKDSIKNGNIAEAKSIASVLAKRGTELGQGVQAYRTLGTDFGDPAASMVFAERGIQKVNEGIAPNFEGKLANVENTFQKIHEDVVEKVIKKVTPLGKAIEKSQFAPEEILASKITPFTKSKKPNAVKDMVATLFKLAKEELPKKAVKPPRNEIDLIGQALRDKPIYQDIWNKAKVIVKEKYKGNSKALDLLDQYFGKSGEFPVSKLSVGKAVSQEVKAQKVDLSKIIREHFTVVDQTGKNLTTKLVEKAGLSQNEASTLATKLETEFKALVTTRKESALKTIFSDRAVAKSKTFVQQVVELSNLGAFDKVQLRDKLAKKLGVVSMSDDLAAKIIKQSEFIQSIPKDAKYEIFKQGENLIKIISDETPVTKTEIFQNVINMPRALMSSFDLSFGLRQGLVTAYRHPVIFARAFKAQFGMLSEKGFENAMDIVMKNPDFELAKKSGLAFTDMGASMARREENFLSSYAEKIPFLGKGVKISARAYTGMANKLRMDVFASLVHDAERIGLNPRTTGSYIADDLAKLVNNLTGRGSLGKYESAAPLLNAVLFSPRLMMSRLSLLNPVYYYKLDPFTRKEALKSMLAYAGATTTILGLAKASGLEVGADPRSSDFGKIKIGNTRIDIMGGFQQYIRMSSQMISGKYISSTTGKEYTLGEGYKPMTRLDIAIRQFESKTSPVTSFVLDLLKGQDYNGGSIYTAKGVGKELLSRVVPMVAQDMIDLYKEDPYLLPLGLLNTVGFGVQTYVPQKKSTIGSGLPQLPKIGGGLPKLPKIKK